MNPIPRHVFLLAGAAALAVAAGIAVSGIRARRSADIAPPPPPSVDPAAFTASPAPGFDAAAWKSVSPDRARGGLARRFRLAGTLFGAGGGIADIPLAVIDDRDEIRQHLVRQGESVVDGVRLVEVRTGEVVLEGPEGQAVLALERASAGKSRPGAADTADADLPSPDRFGGHEVFPGRWEFSREKLLDYYTELRSEPERLVAIFDSMEPLWQNGDPDTHVIEGYQLNVQGEADFFAAMGMKQGDVVRAVNSIRMSNRRRAEACIAAFVRGEEDTFVFDVERDGVPSQKVYVFE